MKNINKIILIISSVILGFGLLLTLPSVKVALADFGATWQATSTASNRIFPAKINGIYPAVFVPNLVATTSTATSSFAGFVGIATTTPSDRLSVDGNIGIYSSQSPSLYLRSRGTGGRAYRIMTGESGEPLYAGSFAIIDENAGNIDRLLINQLGNFGLGTTSPTFKLDIASSTSGILQALRLQNATSTATSSGSQLNFAAKRVSNVVTDIAGVQGILVNNGATSYTGDLIFLTASGTTPTEVGRFTGSRANFGIGSSSPLARLSIVGQAGGSCGGVCNAPDVINVLGGAGGSSGGLGGSIFMQAGIGGGSGSNGGNITLLGGTAAGTNTGGIVTIQGGAPNSSSGTGGPVIIRGGMQGNSGSAAGGNASLLGGDGSPSGGGAAGIAIIAGGIGGSSSGVGTIGGRVNITGGQGGTGSSPGAGGSTYISGGPASSGANRHGDLYLGVNNVSGTPALQGRIAIGTTTISSLSPYFGLVPTSSTTIGFGIGSTTNSIANGNLFIVQRDGNVGLSTTSASARLDIYNRGTQDAFAVSSSSNTRMFTINSIGNVGIGTTTPRAELDIYNNNGVGSSPTIILGGNNGGDTDFFMSRYTNNDAIDNDRFDIGRSFALSSSSLLTISSTGNVGIATTSPVAKLDIYGTAGTSDIFRISSSSNSRLLTLSSLGNLGIGSSTPYAKLGVVSSNSTDMLASFVNTGVADGNGLDIYSRVDPINGGYAATYFSPQQDNHQIYFGEAGRRPYATTFNLKNYLGLNFESGASWAMYANDSAKFNIGTGGQEYFWQGAFGASGSTATNRFRNIPQTTTGAITFAAVAVSGQTADLTQWQNEASTPYSLINNKGWFGVGTTTPSANISITGSSTQSSTAPLFAIASSSNATAFLVNGAGHITTGGQTPTVSACGVTPSVVGNDTAGTITVGAGVVTSCTLTFAVPRAKTPILAGAITGGGLSIAGGYSAKSTTAVTFTFAATVGGGTFDYYIVE